METIKKWEELSPEIRNEFTLNNKIQLVYNGKILDRRNEEPAYATRTSEGIKFYSKNLVNSWIEVVKNKQDGWSGSLPWRVPHYPEIDFELYDLLETEEYSIKNKKVALIGSTEPWYEALVLAYGGIPITIEYNPIQTDDERLTLLTVDDHDKNPQKFDVIFSISSFEHDGLGGYGDPINPNADIESMEKLKSMLKKNGVLFLAVPMGIDKLHWNSFRVYGQQRFWKLINGWKILDITHIPSNTGNIYGRFKEEHLNNTNRYGAGQPLVVLKVEENNTDININ